MALIIALVNQSKCAAISDYTYEVMVGDGTYDGSRVIARGRIEKHKRADGWQALAQRLIDQERA